jgi:hypothetical protein
MPEIAVRRDRDQAVTVNPAHASSGDLAEILVRAGNSAALMHGLPNRTAESQRDPLKERILGLRHSVERPWMALPRPAVLAQSKSNPEEQPSLDIGGDCGEDSHVICSN